MAGCLVKEQIQFIPFFMWKQCSSCWRWLERERGERRGPLSLSLSSLPKAYLKTSQAETKEQLTEPTPLPNSSVLLVIAVMCVLKACVLGDGTSLPSQWLEWLVGMEPIGSSCTSPGEEFPLGQTEEFSLWWKHLVWAHDLVWAQRVGN